MSDIRLDTMYGTCIIWCYVMKWFCVYTTRKRAIGPGQRYQLLLQPVPLALDQPSGGQLAPGGGSNWFQCVSIGTGLNHHPVPNEGGDIGTG